MSWDAVGYLARGEGTEGFRQFGSFIRGKGGPLFQDDRLKRGDFAPRSFGIAVRADIARHRTLGKLSNLRQMGITWGRII
jgi:hypothetical protein